MNDTKVLEILLNMKNAEGIIYDGKAYYMSIEKEALNKACEIIASYIANH